MALVLVVDIERPTQGSILESQRPIEKAHKCMLANSPRRSTARCSGTGAWRCPADDTDATLGVTPDTNTVGGRLRMAGLR